MAGTAPAQGGALRIPALMAERVRALGRMRTQGVGKCHSAGVHGRSGRSGRVGRAGGSGAVWRVWRVWRVWQSWRIWPDRLFGRDPKMGSAIGYSLASLLRERDPWQPWQPWQPCQSR